MRQTWLMNSPKRKHYKALFSFLFAIVFFSSLAILAEHGWLFGLSLAGVLVSVVAYAIFNLAFSCPKCGTPYLYEMKGPVVIPTSFPKHCRNCGLPTNQDHDS